MQAKIIIDIPLCSMNRAIARFDLKTGRHRLHFPCMKKYQTRPHWMLVFSNKSFPNFFLYCTSLSQCFERSLVYHTYVNVLPTMSRRVSFAFGQVGYLQQSSQFRPIINLSWDLKDKIFSAQLFISIRHERIGVNIWDGS